MLRCTGWIFAFVVFCSVGSALAEDAAPAQPIADFTLKDTEGQQRRLGDFANRDAIVVSFLGTECPIAKLYGPRLAQLAEKFPKTQFLAIDSNQQDSTEELAEYGRVHGIKFPLLKDPENAVADLFGAERTPEVFVLNRERQVVYRGRIDDQFGIDSLRDKPREYFLRQALEDLAEGRPVKLPRTEAVGCHIGRVREVDPNAKVTWSNQIARLFQKHCVECHRPGDIGPFDLTQYTDTVGWGPMISEAVRQQRMPPWHASDEFGKFRNRRVMSGDEKQLVYDWVTAGCPLGDPAAAPPPREFPTRWQLPRDPDVVLEMRRQPFTVPAEGTLEYQYFVVDPKFTEDKWIAAAEIVPGNRTVVHHAVAFIRPPDHTDFRGIGWVAGYVPGQRVEPLESGLARRVPAGSKFVFQMHYTPNGSEQQDLTRMGLIFADPVEVKEEVVTLLAMNQTFEIPPGAKDFPVEATLKRFPKDGRLLAIVPHMHVRGSAFRVEADIPGQATETLIDVPRYDFNWQTTYLLEEPRTLPAETKIRCIAKFDNSADNPNNPNPNSPVRWGDQTWEEMALGYFAVAIPLRSAEEEPIPVADEKLTAEQEADIEAKSQKLLKTFDKDGNGVVSKSETPEQFAIFAFRRIDADENGELTMEEIRKAVEQSVRRKARRQR